MPCSPEPLSTQTKRVAPELARLEVLGDVFGDDFDLVVSQPIWNQGSDPEGCCQFFLFGRVVEQRLKLRAEDLLIAPNGSLDPNGELDGLLIVVRQAQRVVHVLYQLLFRNLDVDHRSDQGCQEHLPLGSVGQLSDDKSDKPILSEGGLFGEHVTGLRLKGDSLDHFK